jgi:hypothetical protein
VTAPLSKEEVRLLRKAFRMPSVQSMTSRKTSITNAFVSAIIPVVRPSPEEIREALIILRMTPEDVRCAFCGNKSTEWDHLRPLVVSRRPTGYISEIANLVPACGKCNQSKGNSHWRTWMCGSAPNCPTALGVSDVADRIARLEDFERWREPTLVDFESLVGPDDYAAYWRELDEAVAILAKSQQTANDLRSKIAQTRPEWKPRTLPIADVTLSDDTGA